MNALAQNLSQRIITIILILRYFKTLFQILLVHMQKDSFSRAFVIAILLGFFYNNDGTINTALITSNITSVHYVYTYHNVSVIVSK